MIGYLWNSHTFAAVKLKIMIEYISQEGYDKMVAELHELMSVERPRISEAISEARDKGDLSENFEYHAAKREQGERAAAAAETDKVDSQDATEGDAQDIEMETGTGGEAEDGSKGESNKEDDDGTEEPAAKRPRLS